MSRISKKFLSLKKANKKALITFITAGDPSLSVTEKLIFELEKSGVDIIELGVPFSDPMADGPVIQAASERALKKNVSLKNVLDLVKKVRKRTQIPILLMGYYNPILYMGLEKFAQSCADCGVDAALVVDLPPEENKELRQLLKKKKLDLIHLLAPTSDDNRIQKVAKTSSGFIYYVSMTGVTGAKLDVNQEISQQVQRIRKYTQLPIAVGFGVSKPADAAQVAKCGDGVVVGSALIKIINSSKGDKRILANAARFIKTLRNAV